MASVQHNALTSANLHEPKGADTANTGQVYVADGSGSGSWVGPTYGNMYSSHVDAVTIATIGTTVKTFDGFSHAGPGNNVTVSTVANSLTAVAPGDYYVDFICSFSTVASADSGDYKFHLAINGAESVLGFHRSMSGTADLGSGSFSGIVDLSVDDVLTVLVESDNASDTDDLSVFSASLTINRLR